MKDEGKNALKGDLQGGDSERCHCALPDDMRKALETLGILPVYHPSDAAEVLGLVGVVSIHEKESGRSFFRCFAIKVKDLDDMLEGVELLREDLKGGMVRMAEVPEAST